MSTRRFEGSTIEEAVQAAREALGPNPRLVGATKVRRGGVAGFFSREHVEIEVDPGPGPGPGTPTGPDGLRGEGGITAVPAVAALRPAAALGALWRGGRDVGTTRPGSGGPLDGLARSGGGAGGLPEGHDDALTRLLTEMADNGPSSVLDLAEELNSEQSHFRLSSGPEAPVAVPPAAAPAPVRATGPAANPGADFAEVLEEIARRSGLLPPTEGVLPLAAPTYGPGTEVNHTPRLLAELGGTAGAPSGAAPAPLEGPVQVPAQVQVPALAPPADAPEPVHTLAVPPGEGLRATGLPEVLCSLVGTTVSAGQAELALRRALEHLLPPPLPLPTQPTSVVAVVGPKRKVAAVARLLAEQMGVPAGRVALATQRDVRQQREAVITSPAAADELRLAWRWRSHPAVVAIESPVRPSGNQWAAAVLRALQPVVCWGVADACTKVEDVTAWSSSLGGLDSLALVDLEGTTTPGAALGLPFPVGLVDGQAATPALWASALCSRLQP